MNRTLTTHHRPLAVILALMLATGVLVASRGASAAGNSLTLSGPTSNVMGTNFNYSVTGTAAAPANEVISFEQFTRANGCSPTFAGEAARAYTRNAAYGITYWASAAVSGSYAETDAFGAAHLGVHGVCAYLIGATTGATYAHAQAWWTNHS